MKKVFYLLVLVLIASSCADVSPHVSTCITSNPYGFFGGVWHGWCSGFAFIGSLFSDDIAVYAYNNSGGWYDFGFLIGIGSLLGGAAKASGR